MTFEERKSMASPEQEVQVARVSDIFDMVVADIERDDPLIQKIDQPE